MQQKIKYHEIMSLGFKEEVCSDQQYFKQYGFDYCIITLKLSRKIYIDWAKETQLAEMVRMKDDKTCDIMKRLPINDINHLKEMIDFFSDKKKADSFNPMTSAC